MGLSCSDSSDLSPAFPETGQKALCKIISLVEEKIPLEMGQMRVDRRIEGIQQLPVLYSARVPEPPEYCSHENGASLGKSQGEHVQ